MTASVAHRARRTTRDPPNVAGSATHRFRADAHRDNLHAVQQSRDPNARRGVFVRRELAPDRHAANAGDPGIHETVRRATVILEAIWSHDGPMRLADIARAARLDRSTALRLIHSLDELGYVHRDDAAKTYRIGYMAQRLGARPQLMAVNVSLSRRFVEDVALATGETVYLASLEGVSVIYHHAVAGGALGAVPAPPLGVAHDAHACAAGKTLLANLTDDAVARLYAATRLARMGRRTVTNVAELVDQVRRARIDGIATDLDETADGRAGVAVAVVNARRIANMAIGVMTRSAQFEGARLARLTGACRDAANAIYSHVLC